MSMAGAPLRLAGKAARLRLLFSTLIKTFGGWRR